MATAEQPRVKALHELLNHDLVSIYVGSENTHWVLHEKLLCAKSKFFHRLFYSKIKNPTGSGNKVFGLPDEEDEPFRLFVGWLYSGRVPAPEEEKDLGGLLDVYLMGEKWQIAELVRDALDAVRRWYRTSDTFPGLRRVQYIYANTDEDSPMRQLLVGSVARMLVLGDGVPPHWDRALKKNGQLAVDIIRAIQVWKLEPESVPDAREEAQELETKMVEGVERAEKKQQGVPKNEQQSAETDEAAEAGKDIEKLANGVKGLTNGTTSDQDG